MSNQFAMNIINISMRPELAFLSPFVYWPTKTVSFCMFNCNFELIFFQKKNLNLNKNYAKQQNHAKYHVFKQNFKPR